VAAPSQVGGQGPAQGVGSRGLSDGPLELAECRVGIPVGAQGKAEVIVSLRIRGRLLRSAL
jgi:hypothetical protein